MFVGVDAVFHPPPCARAYCRAPRHRTQYTDGDQEPDLCPTAKTPSGSDQLDDQEPDLQSDTCMARACGANGGVVMVTVHS